MKRIRLSLILISLTLIIFTLFRGILLITYYDEFSALSLFEIFQAFFYGLRFDIALTSILFFFPILLINLPFKWAENKNWLSFWYWVCLPIIIAACLLLAADIAYYAYVKRHITQELRLILHDTFFILQVGLSSYKLALASFVGFGATLFLLWRKAFPKDLSESNSSSIVKRIAIFTLVFFVLALGIRGGTQRKTIHVINAFTTGNPSQGNLILNGAYSALRSFDSKPSVSHTFYSPQDLKKQALEFGLYKQSERYPFQQKFNAQKSNKLNIVIVLLESWSYKYIDALTGNHLGITPNFDKLIAKSLSFDRFYSAGQRSIEGLQAVLTGVPLIIDLPRLGWGLENSKFSRLGSLLKKQGYQTVFTQSSRRTSFHIDGISAAAGFDTYFGMEDMQLELNYPDPSSFWFGWDHETFNKVQNHLATLTQPFISFTFTGSTHAPYGTLPTQFLKYPHNTDNENGFMNTLFYADWALGQFMEKAQQQPWFDNTVFIFTADHTLGHYHVGTPLEQFHIPLVIYSPKHIKPGVNSTISSHLDIFPTIIDLLKLPDTFSALGQSLLSKKNDNQAYAFIHAGNMTGIISNEGYLMHTLQNIVEAKTLEHKKMDKAIQDKLERTLLTVDQAAFQAIKSNTWEQ
jgi:phosphoglycerol transferase MdoB-like AlkP superfamily enzyme